MFTHKNLTIRQQESVGMKNDMQNYNSSCFNKELCLRNANEFYKVAQLLDKQREHGEYRFLIPCIVNLSFACELYLKYLLGRRTNKCKNGHSLFAIYNNLLSTEIKYQINEAFDSNWVRSFEESLLICDKYFVDFRYLHEKDDEWSVHTSDLFRIVHALNTVCNSSRR